MRTDTAGIPGVTGTQHLVLDVPPGPEHVRTARLFAAATARHFGIDEERVEDLKVAVSEACTNAIKAHRDAGVVDPIRIEAAPKPGAVRFSVVDAGRGFEPDGSKGEPPEGYTPPSGIDVGNLGLTLIRSLFPGAEITRNQLGGMTVSILVETSVETSGDAG